jgi:ATP-dependent Clp protease adapter protein ClpS
VPEQHLRDLCSTAPLSYDRGMSTELLDITHAPDWWPQAQDLLDSQGSAHKVEDLAGHCISHDGQLLAKRSGRRLDALVMACPSARTASLELSHVTSNLGRQAAVEFLNALTRYVTSEGHLEVHVGDEFPEGVLQACDYRSDGDDGYVWSALGRARELREHEVRRIGPGSWAVLLSNDEVTTFDFVTSTLMAACGYGYPLAWALAVCTHFEGRCVVAVRRKRDEAEDVRELIAMAATRANFPLVATVEQLPD